MFIPDQPGSKGCPAEGAAALELQRPESLRDVQSPAVTFASISPAVGVGGCSREAKALARARRHPSGVFTPSFPETQRALPPASERPNLELLEL